MPMLDKVLRFLTPQPGKIGGHASADFADALDLDTEETGLYDRYENVDPLRGQGVHVKRRTVMGRQARAQDVSAFRIAKSIWQHGVSVIISNADVIRGILWAMYDDSDTPSTHSFSKQTYEPSKYYESGNWETAECFDNGDTPTADNNCVYTGGEGGQIRSALGQWKNSVLGHVNMAMGAFKDTVPMKALFINRRSQQDATYQGANGFFADPNTVANGGGRVSKEGFCVVREKPWLSVSGTYVKTTLLIPDQALGLHNEDIFIDSDNSVYRPSGQCFLGPFKFWYVPIDERGEPGPPILTEEINVPNRHRIDDVLYFYLRGVTIQQKLRFFDGDIERLRPNMIAVDVYGKWDNTAPDSESWTEGFDAKGYGLDAVPESVPACFVTRIWLCGRQFDPNNADAFIGTDYVNAKWPSSPQFNTFIGMRSEKIRVKKKSNTVLHIYDWQAWAWQFSHKRTITASFDSDDNVHIEILGIAGTHKISEWAFARQKDDSLEAEPEPYIRITLASALTNAAAAWANNTYKDIRFCFPWRTPSADNYDINIFISDPSMWDQSKLLPFPEDATADYSLDYPNYYGHCESPDGRMRHVWDYWQNGKSVKNILRYNTNRSDGGFDHTRFPLSLPMPFEITDSIFIDALHFIVTGHEKSALCERYEVDGQWFARVMDDSYEYGHSMGNLVRHKECVVGCDAKLGVWILPGVDIKRTHPAVSPIGRQISIMPTSTLGWFVDKMSERAEAQREEEWKRSTISIDGNNIKFLFPNLMGNASGGDGSSGKNRIQMRDVNTAGGSFWLSLYWHENRMIWSYDYVYSDSKEGMIGLFDMTLGPAKTLIGHMMTYFVGFSDADADERDRANGVDYNNIRSFLKPFRFRIPQIYPARAPLQRFWPRIRKWGTTNINPYCTVTPYIKGVAGSSTQRHNAASRWEEWERGINARADSWTIQLHDISAGTAAFEEVQLRILDRGRKRAGGGR